MSEELATVEHLEERRPHREAESSITDMLKEIQPQKAKRSFKSLDGVLQLEKNQREGRWFPWPMIDGASIWIAHMKASRDKLEELQADWRSENRWKERDLPSGVLEGLMWLAGFGTFVKGWSGIVLDGKEVPYGTAGYHRLLKVDHFKDFVTIKATDEDLYYEEIEEEAKKA